jgi:hypothetical protein
LIKSHPLSKPKLLIATFRPSLMMMTIAKKVSSSQFPKTTLPTISTSSATKTTTSRTCHKPVPKSSTSQSQGTSSTSMFNHISTQIHNRM